MCIAILKRKEGIITDEALAESFERNPDGAGIAYTKNNELIIEKGIFDKKQFIDKVRQIEQICDNNMLIHCRIGTSGGKDELNTHPFFVNENVALIHNGILNIDVPKKSKINDTQIFIINYLKDIPQEELMHNKCVLNLIFSCIGNHNKFVLLDNTGCYKIINEKAGHWKDNVWYSNNSYIPIVPLYPKGWADCLNDDYFYGKQGKFRFNNSIERIHPKKLKKREKEYLYTFINNLTVKDFALLDLCPVYDSVNKMLIPVEKAQDTNYEFLEDVSEELFEYYIQQFNDVCFSDEAVS